MSDHAPTAIERHCDVAIIGASTAGLAAAVQLGCRRRSVIVIDVGEPRTTPAAHQHGHLGRDGLSPPEPTDAGRDEVRSHGGEILAGRASRVTLADDDRWHVELTGGHTIVARRLFAATGADHLSGLDGIVETDPTDATALPGLTIAGDMTDPKRQVSPSAEGSRVGTMIDLSLTEDDTGTVGRPSASQIDWDRRYAGDRLWSGNPNGTLVHEARDLEPGRALDVGAGEGADALWLAERGWDVTANDISRLALDRIGAEAARRGLSVELHHADANELDAFAPGAFDLVSALYASIPRTPDRRAVQNLVSAVAPGGTLLVVSHDLEPMRAPIDTRTHSRAFDPDAYVRVEDVAAALAESSEWEIEVHEQRRRPPGAAASAAHHVNDVVLRARRRAAW
jgi:SAM-dependent methyltransferase